MNTRNIKSNRQITNPTLRAGLDRFFQLATEAGYFARQKFYCCTSCGNAAVPDGTKKCVFYHEQDSDRMVARNDGTFLTWTGDGAELVRFAEQAGLLTWWDGSEHTKVWVGIKLSAEMQAEVDQKEAHARALTVAGALGLLKEGSKV